MATRSSPDEALYGAVITQLRATAAVTALATGGAFSEVPPGTSAPYAKVNIATGRRLDTASRFGASTLIDVDAVSQGESQRTGLRLRSAIMAALNGQLLAMSGHSMLALIWDENTHFDEVVNGIKTHHHVATFRAWTEQP